MFDMIGNIFKNLERKPATRLYPFEKREAFKASRGRVGGIDPEQCIFCGLCARKCPANAITVDRNTKTWEVNPFKCVICGACAEVCPKKCLSMDEAYTKPADAKNMLKYTQAPKEETTNESQAG